MREREKTHSVHEIMSKSSAVRNKDLHVCLCLNKGFNCASACVRACAHVCVDTVYPCATHTHTHVCLCVCAVAEDHWAEAALASSAANELPGASAFLMKSSL